MIKSQKIKTLSLVGLFTMFSQLVQANSKVATGISFVIYFILFSFLILIVVLTFLALTKRSLVIKILAYILTILPFIWFLINSIIQVNYNWKDIDVLAFIITGVCSCLLIISDYKKVKNSKQ